jgi:hypothetical protein
MSGLSDRLFRYGYTHPDVAEAELRYNLHPELVAAVNWPTLRYEPEIVVDSQRESRKDVVLSAQLLGNRKRDPPHLFLMEHQMRVEPRMVWRMHDYNRRIIDYYLRRYPESKWIPEVTPLVVYTRKGKGWWARRELYGPAGGNRPWGDKLGLNFSYGVDDMALFTDQQVMERPGPALGPLLLLVLSYAGTRQLAERLLTWRELFVRVYAEPNGLRKLYEVMYYLQQKGDLAAYAAAKELLYSVLKKKEEAERVMWSMGDVIAARTKRKWAPVFRAEGREEGRVEGRDEGLVEGESKGRAASLLKLLAARGLHVDDVARQLIENCRDVATLDRWLDRALVATRIEDVLDDPEL